VSVGYGDFAAARLASTKVAIRLMPTFAAGRANGCRRQQQSLKELHLK
jgi:hypothetical protein